MSFMEEFHHLQIQLKDITIATDNFSPNKLIGRGGFGLVYKGELSLPEGPKMVAFKRLDRKLGQGNTEFWKEIMMLSKYKHENLVTLLHFCIEGDERILVYEYVSRGSLDSYLGDVNLTWIQRLKICIEVANALNYLHDPIERHRRVLHQDVKSSNILLDEKWSAKVSDFGLSKLALANQTQTYNFSNAVGTVGYCDPLYWETGFLSKESDVYSFGVVLFEVMCGKLCCEYRNGNLVQIFVHTWKKCYDEKRLDDIIFQDLKEQIDQDSLTMFYAIANRCLNRDHKERPTMFEIIKELEVVYEQQVATNLFKIANMAGISYKSNENIFSLLSKGTLVADRKTWLSINKNEKICEMISATKCISGELLFIRDIVEDPKSRFSNVVKGVMDSGFKVEVSTEFLTPHVTYTINLVFKHSISEERYVPFKYKLDDETHYSTSCKEYFLREDGWLTAELYQFTSYQRKHDFRIQFVQPFQISSSVPLYLFEGIEFWPTEHGSHENLKDKNKEDMQSLSMSNLDWERKLPTNYTHLIMSSKKSLSWTTKKELYLVFRKGYLFDKGEKWFSINKNSKQRLMISARAFLQKEEWIWKSLPESESRFEVVAESLKSDSFGVAVQIKSTLLSPLTTYSCHFMYKLPENYSLLEGFIVLLIKSSPRLSGYLRAVNLMTLSSHIPFIGSKNQESYTPRYTSKINSHPKLRKDGWMELRLGEVSTDDWGAIKMYIGFSSHHDKHKNMNFVGLVVQGIEFRSL